MSENLPDKPAAKPVAAPKKTDALASPSGKLKAGDEEYMRDLRASLLSNATPGANLSLYLMFLVIVVALIWAGIARVEEITQGQAKVIPSTREQLIQSLESGILSELMVREGDVVEKGQVLLRMDPTRADASLREGQSKAVALRGTASRLRAEAFGTPLSFPPEVQAVPSVVRDESEAFNARRRALDESTTALQRSLDLAEKEIAMSEPLAERGLLSEVELLRMRRQANEFRLQIAERRNRYRAEANAELVRIEGELAQTVQNVELRRDVSRRTTIMAPVRGTVKNVKVTTIGGVIQQGQDIMEIVPLEDQLLVEAKIRPSDVAFLRPGLKATVKVTAYDYAIYGGLDGVVELISPDTMREDRRAPTNPNQPDDSYYKIVVRTKSSTLNAGGKELPIIPGMTATVEIRTGEKTVLEYLLKPIFKAREAFRER